MNEDDFQPRKRRTSVGSDHKKTKQERKTKGKKTRQEELVTNVRFESKKVPVNSPRILKAPAKKVEKGQQKIFNYLMRNVPVPKVSPRSESKLRGAKVVPVVPKKGLKKDNNASALAESPAGNDSGIGGESMLLVSDADVELALPSNAAPPSSGNDTGIADQQSLLVPDTAVKAALPSNAAQPSSGDDTGIADKQLLLVPDTVVEAALPSNAAQPSSGDDTGFGDKPAHLVSGEGPESVLATKDAQSESLVHGPSTSSGKPADEEAGLAHSYAARVVEDSSDEDGEGPESVLATKDAQSKSLVYGPSTSSGMPADEEAGLAHSYAARVGEYSSDEDEPVRRRSGRARKCQAYASATDSDASEYTLRKRREAQTLRAFESSGSENNYKAPKETPSDSDDGIFDSELDEEVEKRAGKKRRQVSSNENMDPDDEMELSDTGSAFERLWGVESGHEAARADRKRSSGRSGGPANKKRKQVDLAEEPASKEQLTPATKKRDRDLRREKCCPYCPLKVKQHLDRHIQRCHPDKAGTPQAAKKIAKTITQRAALSARMKAPIGSIKLSELEQKYGDFWPSVKEITLGVMADLRVVVKEEVQAPAENSDEESEGREDLEEARNAGNRREDASVKRLKKDLGLYGKVHDTHPIVFNYKQTRADLGKNPRATDNAAARLGHIFAFATKELPGKTPWEVLTDHRTCFEHLRVSGQECGTAPATLLNYAKDMARVCEYARERWTQVRDMPKTEQFQEALKVSHVFWKDKQAAYGEETETARNTRIDAGKAKVADLDHGYEYIEDPAEAEKISKALERLESAARLTDVLVISRKDTGVLEAWNTVVRFLMVVSLIENASRAGVLENMTMEELEHADKIRGTWLVQVAHHKRARDGAAKVRIRDNHHQLYKRYLAVRAKVKVKRPHDKLLFVTSGGQPFRTYTQDFNRWNKAHGYAADVTANQIRRVTQDAAATQAMDVQNSVTSHLAHSLATAHKHYRSRDLEASYRGGEAVQLAQHNYRVIKAVERSPREFFANVATFPEFAEVEEMCRRHLKMPGFKLTQKTYEHVQAIFEHECQ